jgi:hypothetical protein
MNPFLKKLTNIH